MAPSLSRSLPVWLAALILPVGCNPDPASILPASPSPVPVTSPTPTPSAQPSPTPASPSPSATAKPAYTVPTGTITSVVGYGAKGFAGDDHDKATDAKLQSPWGIAMVGIDLWIADSGNARIRRYRPDTNTVSTYIGTGVAGFNGDNKPLKQSNLSNPLFVLTAANDSIYIVDTYANRIRKVDAITGLVTTVAGTGGGGLSGDGGPATSATLANPTAAAVTSTETLYIADSGNNAIRRVSGGTITTVAGTGQASFSNDGKAGPTAQLRYPEGLILGDAGSVLIADSGNNRIRRLMPDGTITTIAGDGTQGFGGDGGPATKAQLSRPIGMALAPDGSLFFADAGNRRIRVVAPDGTIHTVSGTGANGYSGDGGPALQAAFGLPAWVARDAEGDLYVSDAGAGALDTRIRKIEFTK
jgi:sugar lactone lactonase YvrE